MLQRLLGFRRDGFRSRPSPGGTWVPPIATPVRFLIRATPLVLRVLRPRAPARGATLVGVLELPRKRGSRAGRAVVEAARSSRVLLVRVVRRARASLTVGSGPEDHARAVRGPAAAASGLERNLNQERLKQDPAAGNGTDQGVPNASVQVRGLFHLDERAGLHKVPGRWLPLCLAAALSA